jgi:hypothetical protein
LLFLGTVLVFISGLGASIIYPSVMTVAAVFLAQAAAKQQSDS